MYDRSTLIDVEEFKDRVALLNTLNDDKSLRVLFNTRSIKSNFDSIKSFLGCVNTILEPYSLKICSILKDTRKGKERIRITKYGLKNITGRENIDELLQYRINKGFVINSDIRIFTNNNVYKDLIKIKAMAPDDEDETVYKI